MLAMIALADFPAPQEVSLYRLDDGRHLMCLSYGEDFDGAIACMIHFETEPRTEPYLPARKLILLHRTSPVWHGWWLQIRASKPMPSVDEPLGEAEASALVQVAAAGDAHADLEISGSGQT